MERKTIPLERETVRDSSSYPNMGPIVLDLPEGTALCHDAVGSTIITASRETGEKFVALITAAEFDGQLLGTLVQFTSASARLFASSLIASADQIDGGGITN